MKAAHAPALDRRCVSAITLMLLLLDSGCGSAQLGCLLAAEGRLRGDLLPPLPIAPADARGRRLPPWMILRPAGD